MPTEQIRSHAARLVWLAALLSLLAAPLSAAPAAARADLTEACYAWVRVGAVTLYAQANEGAAILGSAPIGARLRVDLIVTDGQGWRWARTPEGWFALDTQAIRTAELTNALQCRIMLGESPVALPGLHILNDMGHDATLAYVRRMAEAGYPVSTLKGLNGTERTLTEAKQISPQTVTVFRSLHNPDGFGDCPANITAASDPVAAARHWVDGMAVHWQKVDADYYELVNECPFGLGWLVQFSMAAMEVANERGFCLLLLSLNVGSPQPEEFSALLPLFRYALAHPCQSGRLHGIALHAYSMDDRVMLSAANEWLTLRYRMIYDTLRPWVPEIDRVPAYLTEVGVGWGSVVPACDWLARDMVRFSRQLERTPYLRGFHLWDVGPDRMGYDVGPCLPQVADALIRYYRTGVVP